VCVGAPGGGPAVTAAQCDWLRERRLNSAGSGRIEGSQLGFRRADFGGEAVRIGSELGGAAIVVNCIRRPTRTYQRVSVAMRSAGSLGFQRMAS
jgi:hypothetical protein